MSLTASHSSTIAEETIKLLRVLHSLSACNKKINEFICLKMSLVNEIISSEMRTVRHHQFPLSHWKV